MSKDRKQQNPHNHTIILPETLCGPIKMISDQGYERRYNHYPDTE